MKNGTYILSYAGQDGENLTTEWFYDLQHAIVRLLQVEPEYSKFGFTAAIEYDNQNNDGQLYEICDYTTNRGFEFTTTPIPMTDQEK